eukprot:7352155-Pyramimonas_sp.AAC.1
MVDTIATLVSTGKGSIPMPDCPWRACLAQHQELAWLWLHFEPPRVQAQCPLAAGEAMPELEESSG